MDNPAIIVVTYNRPESLRRLLSSLDSARYPQEPVDLFISIDFQDSASHTEVVNMANAFEWKYGAKKVIGHTQNLGLKKHVLSIGAILENYESAVVLEDDIFVAKDFYRYASQATAFYKDDLNIAGISLYNFSINQITGLPFVSQKTEKDVYFMRIAQSWGQVWMKKQWKAFTEWFSSHDEEFTLSPALPPNICRWPKSSWLKHHYRYCVEQEKYFVYPYVSLSTNFGDSGFHNKINNPTYQVPLQYGEKKDFVFEKLSADSVCYDGFYERINLGSYLGIDENSLCTDFYGAKQNREGKKYLLTPEVLDYQILNAFGYQLKPYELNVMGQLKGGDLYLYDTEVSKPGRGKGNESLKQVQYLFQFVALQRVLEKIGYQNILKYYINLFRNKLKK